MGGLKIIPILDLMLVVCHLNKCNFDVECHNTFALFKIGEHIYDVKVHTTKSSFSPYHQRVLVE